MKIVLINPPQLYAKTLILGVTPPLGLLYLASSLKQAGHEPVIIDSIVEAVTNIYQISGGIAGRGLSFNDIISRIPDDAGLIGISNLFSCVFPLVRELTMEIKKVYPAIPVVVGGAHPSAAPIETVSEPSIDFVVIGEGDKTIIELVDNIKEYNAIKEIDGLAYKDEKGIPSLNPKTKFIENLDSIPFPARELIPLEKYYKTGEAHGSTQDRWTPIVSSRGCPYQCTFCASPRRYRARTAEDVLDEIEECIKKYNITEFHFEDDNFTLSKKRTIEICTGILKRKLKIRWQTPNGIRASVTDEEMLDVMKEAGCHHITVAPESGSDRVLNEIIRKQQDMSKVTAVVRYASKIGMKTAAYFLIGLPGETIDDVEMSIDYACELAKVGLDEVAVGNFVPLPGSELYEKLVKEGRFNNADWKSLMSMGDFFKAKSWSEHIPSERLDKLRIKAYLKFYLTKGIYHPFKVIRSVVNVIRGKEELKTERTLLSFIRGRVAK